MTPGLSYFTCRDDLDIYFVCNQILSTIVSVSSFPNLSFVRRISWKTDTPNSYSPGTPFHSTPLCRVDSDWFAICSFGLLHSDTYLPLALRRLLKPKVVAFRLVGGEELNKTGSRMAVWLLHCIGMNAVGPCRESLLAYS